MRSDDVREVREISLFSSMGEKHFDDLLKMAYLQGFRKAILRIFSTFS
jgi:hypothetical protein